MKNNNLMGLVTLAHDDARDAMLAKYPGEVKLVSGELQYCAVTPQRSHELLQLHSQLVELYFNRRSRG